MSVETVRRIFVVALALAGLVAGGATGRAAIVPPPVGEAPGSSSPEVAAIDAGAGLRALLERRAAAFVAAFNAPGDDPLLAFARDHLETRLTSEGPATRFVEAMAAQRATLGRLDRHLPQILRDGRLLFVVVQSARSGAWFNFQFRVHPEDGNRLQLVFVSQDVEPVARPQTPIEAPATRAWLDRYVELLGRQRPFSGVALVVEGGRELWSTVQGVAVAEPPNATLPMTRATRLNMASGSKLFTAVAVLQLVDDGKLTLDTRLAKLLPDFPNRDWAAQVTVRQLLTHTAGAGDYWDDEYEKSWGAITATAEMLPHVLRHVGSTPVGDYSYSNSGYIVLGLVAERITGKSYYDLVQERIFARAGMKATGFPLRSRAGADVARPYRPEYDAGAVRIGSYVPVTLGERGTAAGGAVSTVDDLVAFVRALANGTLLRPATFREMISEQVSQGAQGLAHGLGPILETEGTVTSWGHGGTARGTQFELRVYPARDLVAIVMSNYDTVAGYELAQAIDDIVRASPVMPAP
ncbi:MAG: serine hydrolase domain-containing protein [Thermoanaerobaculia bacterium]